MACQSKTLQEFIDKFWSRVDKESQKPCWIWMGAKSNNGYGRVLYSPHKKNYYTHRVSLLISGIEIPEGQYVCHTCDNPSCVNPSHLFVGTAADNHNDCKNKNRHSSPPRLVMKRGSMVPARSVLIPEQVRSIKTMLETKTIAEIARIYGVGETTIRHIKQGKTWQWLEQ